MMYFACGLRTALLGVGAVGLLLGAVACAGADDPLAMTDYLGSGGSFMSTGGGTSSGGDPGTIPGTGGMVFGSTGGSDFGTGGSNWGTGGDSAGTGGASTGGTVGTGGAGTGGASSGLGVQVYLLFGQSNMWGVPAAEAQDKTTNAKVEVMALTSCAGQQTDQWYPAAPPLHGCIGQGSGNPGLGPGDYFGKTIAAAYPNDTILLVPNAIPGVSIDVFAKGQTAYNSMVARAKKAQERGTIRGIIFHQGETDSGSNTWITRVKAVVDNLRSDLGLSTDVPFIAGELPYTGCCGTYHNPIINDLPNKVQNAHVVSASGLGILGDNLHFNTAAQREFGKRYANVMLPLLP